MHLGGAPCPHGACIIMSYGVASEMSPTLTMCPVITLRITLCHATGSLAPLCCSPIWQAGQVVMLCDMSVMSRSRELPIPAGRASSSAPVTIHPAAANLPDVSLIPGGSPTGEAERYPKFSTLSWMPESMLLQQGKRVTAAPTQSNVGAFSVQFRNTEP